MNAVQKSRRRTAEKAPSKWGDAEARRRDILAAARALMKKGGQDALTMRDVALRARVSPGTLYVYFKTKEEIFLTLYAERVDQLAAEAGRIGLAARSFGDLFVGIATAYRDFYEDYGKSLGMFALLADQDAVATLPADLVDRLRGQVMSVFASAEVTARTLLVRHGRRLSDHALTMPFLWTVVTGLAEHGTGPRARAVPYRWEDMARFAAQTLEAGLTHDKHEKTEKPR